MKTIEPSIKVRYYLEIATFCGEEWTPFRVFNHIQTAIDKLQDLKEKYPEHTFRLLQAEYTVIG